VAPLEEKGRNRPLFRFTAHLDRVAGLMADGGIVPVKTNRMAFCVIGKVMLGNLPHLLCEWVGGGLDGARFAIPEHYAQSAESWALITDPSDVGPLDA
jgi:hypothetical protein